MSLSHSRGPWLTEPDSFAEIITRQERAPSIYSFEGHHIASLRFLPLHHGGAPFMLGNAKLMAAAIELHEVVKQQQQAIDLLFAMLIEKTKKDDEKFFPSKSGLPWQAATAAHALLQRLEGNPQ